MRGTFSSLTISLVATALFICLGCSSSAPKKGSTSPASPAENSSSSSRPGNFTVIGPGGGGSLYNPTINPSDPDTVLTSTDMTGAYITHDGGRSWRMFNLRGAVNFFAFDPKTPHTIYADTIGLWRSIDNGKSWKLVYPRPSHITGLNTSNDNGGVVIMAKPDPLGTITAFAVDPADSNTLYAAADKQKNSALWVSRDYGKTWKKQASLPETARRLWVNPHSPASARKLVLMGTGFAEIVTGSDVKKIQLPGSAADRHSPYTFIESARVSAGFTASGTPVLYVVSKTGGSVSTDGGEHWHAFALPGKFASTGKKGGVSAIATSLNHPETAYLSIRAVQLDGVTSFGVMKTVDAGRTWKFSWKESGHQTAPNLHDAWITKRFGPGWSRNPQNMAVDDGNPNLVYASDAGRIFKTDDGGKEWNQQYSHRVSGGWTTAGLDPTTCYGIFFDPFDHNHQFIAYTDIGLFSSDDGGKSWNSASIGIPDKWVNTTYWLVFDPKVKGLMWAANSYDHDLPRPKMWRHESVTDFDGGVVRSTDGGKTWEKSNAGMAPTAATDIVLDPTSPVNARVLYVAGFGDGVFKSTDGGKSWTLKNKGITQKDPFAWRIVRDQNGTLYLLIARRSEDGSIGNSGDGAMYKSTNGADSWTPVKLPSGVNGPNGLAIDPRNPQRLYLAAWPRAVGMQGEGGGVYLSTDGGKSWKNIFHREEHVYDVTIDPKHPDTIYAAGYDSSAWISRDQGKNWSRIAGPNFHWMDRVIPDPDHPGKIYIATFGGSVWHGDLTGKGWTDIATPELQPGR
jgi:photosystem II stability/assembly factor-like uncharacterized protein